MRITRLSLSGWRGIGEVDIVVAADTSLVSVVGDNGTGKSSVLEVLASAAHRLGISAGFEILRGNPLDEPHRLEVTWHFADADDHETKSRFLPVASGTPDEELLQAWAGTVRLVSAREVGSGSSAQLLADGVDPSVAGNTGERIAGWLRQRREVSHLYLDADRSYPPVTLHPQQYGEALNQPWDEPEWTKQWSFRPTKTLYEEWLKFFLAREQRAATAFFAGHRAASVGEATRAPDFSDPFAWYRSALATVLPHLSFGGPDTVARTLQFRVGGREIPFSKLSGGEREIAFLVGQMDRFRLTEGLLLLDEPELHLNPELLRTWLSFLRDSVSGGQVWVATHAAEAVEVAGRASSFVLDRNPDTRLVHCTRSLEQRPVLAALAASIGAPAFSPARRKFVLLEGSKVGEERERYYRLCGHDPLVRFIEYGGGAEVVRAFRDLRELAAQSGEEFRIGAVVDRDLKTRREIEELTAQGVHVLGCHEIENMFLAPPDIDRLAQMNGRPLEATSLIHRLGATFWMQSVLPPVERACGPLSGSPKKRMAELGLEQAHAMSGDAWLELLITAQVREDVAATIVPLLVEEIRHFVDQLNSQDAWANVPGKPVEQLVARELGYSSAVPFESAVAHLWRSGEQPIPHPAQGLIDYIARL